MLDFYLISDSEPTPKPDKLDEFEYCEELCVCIDHVFIVYRKEQYGGSDEEGGRRFFALHV